MKRIIGTTLATNYSFQVALWGTIIFSIGVIIIDGIDIFLGFQWGFTLKDVLMTIVVLVGAIIVKWIGTKIIIAFGRGGE